MFSTVIEKFYPKIQKCLENYMPRRFDQETMNFYFTEPKYTSDVDSATHSLLDPLWDLLDRGGKRWRPVLVALIAEIFNKDIEDILPVAFLCEIVHNGSLIIDDIEDDSQLRRGKPCVHISHHVDVAINVGCFMYFAPLVLFREIRKEGKYEESLILKAYELYAEEMIKIHLGQGLDIWWHSGNKNPSESEYLQMCAYKTGTLARLSARLSTLFCGGNDEQLEKIGSFAEAIGVAFQIQDDLLNLTGEEFSQKISMIGEDIYEGKRSLMVIHTLLEASEEDSNRLSEILNMHTRDENLIKEAIDLMKKNITALNIQKN